MSDDYPKPGEVFWDEDGTKSTVLPDPCDPNYNPPLDELEEYATFIGIDVKKEKHLMWIALEGLRAPLPAEWRACQTGEEEVYYFNFRTGESLWDHPMDNVFKQKVAVERSRKREDASESKGDKLNLGGSGTFAAKKEGSGATKAITATLLGGGPTVNKTGPQVTPLKTGRLTAIGNEPAQATSRRALDSPNMLSHSGYAVLGKPNGTKEASLITTPNRQTSNSFTFSTHKNSPQIMSTQEMEKAARKKIEDELDKVFKAEQSEGERNFILEKQRLEAAFESSKASLNAEWSKEQEIALKTMTANTSREVNELTGNWERRLKALQETCSNLEKELRAAKGSCDHFKNNTVSVEDYAQQIKTVNDLKVSEKREALKSETSALLSKIENEESEAIQKSQEQAKALVATTLQREEADFTRTTAEDLKEMNRSIESLENKVSQLHEEIEKERVKCESLAKSKASLASLRAQELAAATSSPAIAKAQEAAKKEVEMEEARIEEEVQQIRISRIEEMKKLQLELKNLQSFIEDIRRTTPAVPSIDMGELDCSLAETHLKTLSEEDAAAEQSLMANEMKYKAETVLAVQRKKEELGKAFTGTLSNEDTVISPIDESKPAEVKAQQVHLQKIKELEQLHEQTVKRLKEAHHRALDSQDRFDIRKSSEYTKKLNEKKKAWLAAHPSPSYTETDLPLDEDLERAEKNQLPEITEEEVENECNKRESSDPEENRKPSALSNSMSRLEEEKEALEKRLLTYRKKKEEEVQNQVRYMTSKIEVNRSALERKALSDEEEKKKCELLQKNNLSRHLEVTSQLTSQIAEMNRKIEALTEERKSQPLVQRIQSSSASASPQPGLASSPSSGEATEKLKSARGDRLEALLIEVKTHQDQLVRLLQSRRISTNLLTRNGLYCGNHCTFSAAGAVQKREKPPVCPDCIRSSGMTQGSVKPPLSHTHSSDADSKKKVTPQEEWRLKREAVRQQIYRQKKELKEEQNMLEYIREQWKRDMFQAKGCEETAKIYVLREAKYELEEIARQLNYRVLDHRHEWENLAKTWDLNISLRKAHKSKNCSAARERHQRSLSQHSFHKQPKEVKKKLVKNRNNRRGPAGFPPQVIETAVDSSYFPNNYVPPPFPSFRNSWVQEKPSFSYRGLESNEIRWERVNYQNQVERWLQQQALA